MYTYLYMLHAQLILLEELPMHVYMDFNFIST
jgi:hypothetical protein